MGIKEMQIMFDNPWATYYPGSTVSGRLVLNLDTPKKVREIKIKIKGGAEVEWTEQESRTNSDGTSTSDTVHYKADESYFENKFNVAGECEIPAGTHNYDFTTILPPSLPSSYEGQYGHIRYTVKAVLDRPWKFDQEAKAAFTVISHVDLNLSQEARRPLRQSKEKTVGALCCTQGSLSAEMTAPYSGYTSGQTIPLTVSIENGSNTNVTPGYVLLRKVVSYKSHRPSNKVKTEETEIVKVNLTAVGAHGTDSQYKQIVIPSLPATNTIGSSIITIVYEIKVNIPVSGMFAKGIKLKAPVLLGTVPIVTAEPPPASGGPTPASPGDNGNLTHLYPELRTVPIMGAVAPPPPTTSSYGEPSPGQLGWSDNISTVYPDLPPPSYEECVFGKADTIQDTDDNEHTMGVGGWVPRYPTYNFTPSAPPQPLVCVSS